MTARSARLFAVVSALALVTAADWPVFRGNPQQDGVSPEKLPDKLVELWKVTTGESVEGTPAIADGVVYVGSLDQHVYALGLKDGTEKWKFKAGPFKTPVGVHKGKIYVGDQDGAFFCLSAAGKELWKFATENEVTSGASFASLPRAAGELTVADDLIIFGCGDESLYCLDAAGKKRWQFRVPGGPVMATPPVADGRTFASGCDSKLHFVDLATGKESAAIDLDGQTAATPALRGDMLYVGTMSNQVLAIDVKKKELTWSFESEKRKQPFYASAAVTDKLVVAGSRDKRVYAIDRANGKEVWNFVTEGRIEGSPVVAGDRVYVGSTDKNLYVIELATGKELQRVTLDESILGSPAVANGRLVIGTTKGTVYCFGAK
jgi:outer membrane protein assembly factor BamB